MKASFFVVFHEFFTTEHVERKHDRNDQNSIHSILLKHSKKMATEMYNQQQKRLSTRAFTSSIITFSFLGTVLTSLILYISPHHYVADWFGWQILGIELDLWEDLHLVLGLVFIFFGLYHIYLNWRPLVVAFKNKRGEQRGLRRESFYATIFFVVVIAGTVSEIPPFSTVIDLADPIRESFDHVEKRSVVPHAEQIPLDILAKILETDTQIILKKLKEAGYRNVSARHNLETLAEDYDTTPLQLYEIIQKDTLR